MFLYTGYEVDIIKAHQADIRKQFSHSEVVQQAKASSNEHPERNSNPYFSWIRRSHMTRRLVNLLVLLIGLVIALVQLTGNAHAQAISPNSHAKAAYQNATFMAESNVKFAYSVIKSLASNPGQVHAAVSNSSALYGSLNLIKSQAYQQLPRSSYLTWILVKDIPFQLREEYLPSRNYIGQWEFNLSEEGLYTASIKGSVIFSGNFSYSGTHLITFTSSPDSLTCRAEGEIAGSYNWLYDGKVMMLEPVSEKCYERALVLTSHFLTVPLKTHEPVEFPRGQTRVF